MWPFAYSVLFTLWASISYSSNGVNSETYFTRFLSIKLDETRKNTSAIENSDAGSCYHLQFSPEDYLKCQL